MILCRRHAVIVFDVQKFISFILSLFTFKLVSTEIGRFLHCQTDWREQQRRIRPSTMAQLHF